MLLYSFYPRRNFRRAHAPIETHSILPIASTCRFCQIFSTGTQRAADGGTEGNDSFAVEIMLFHKAVYDMWRLLPPQGIANINGVVWIPVFYIADVGRSIIRIMVFRPDTTRFVTIIEIIRCIRLFRPNFKYVPPVCSAIVLATFCVFPVAEKYTTKIVSFFGTSAFSARLSADVPLPAAQAVSTSINKHARIPEMNFFTILHHPFIPITYPDVSFSSS